MSEPTNMANMFWNLDKISETTAIHSGFRLCPIISHSSILRTIPVAFITIPPVFIFLAVSIRRNWNDIQNQSWAFPGKI